MQKKSKTNFSNCKNKHAKKKHKIIFQKKMQKKQKCKKKGAKKSMWGVTVFCMFFHKYRD